MIDPTEHIFTLLTGFFVLYAQVHYRILGLFSRYFKKEPEIVADVPWRIEPGKPLPLLMLVKDADRYPVLLKSVLVTVKNNTRVFCEQEYPIDENVGQKWWWRMEHIQLPESCRGELQIAVQIHYVAGGQEKRTTSDNYALTSKSPFTVYADSDPLPKEPDWYFGDLHVHTELTDDQVEFGAPMRATREMARAMGLQFFAATDHSYDLDDADDDYLTNDPALPKWQRLWEQVELLNSQDGEFVIIPGEELSAGNADGRNVHFLILNNREYLPGSGDSAEKWLKTRPELSVEQALERVDNGALTFAAHPANRTPFLQWLLIRRGKWLSSDYRRPKLTGLQAWNGENNYGFNKGINEWVKLLLEGYRPVLIGGNDAHGNFAIFRQIIIPHLFMAEKESELFGRVRTGVFLPGKPGLMPLLEAIRQGKCIVTDGPFAALKIANDTSEAAIGEVYHHSRGMLEIRALSSLCFGEIKGVTLIVGDISRKKEIRSISFKVEPDCYSFKVETFLGDLPRRGYLRLLVSTSLGSQCLTNPIFLES